MASLLLNLQANVYDVAGATRAYLLQQFNITDEEATVTEYQRSTVTIANGASDERLDVWGGGAAPAELATIQSIALRATGAITVKVGTVATEAITLRVNGTYATLYLDCTVTRSATVGIWLANTTGADVTVTYALAGA